MWRYLAPFFLWGFAAAADPLEVDVELFLAVDVSRSMSPAELEIQRRGYAEALRSDDVVEAITGGLIGSVALTYVEWAGTESQRVVIPWTLVDSRAAAEAFADRVAANFDPSLRRTSISGVLEYATQSIEENEFYGLRRVIDISGDGPNNHGRPAPTARDAAIAAGLTINGLPLMTRDAFGARWHLEDLDAYYEHCVIGGPGAFAIPVLTWDQFAQAVRRKLVLEIAGAPIRRGPVLLPAQHRGDRGAVYDCLIGEKIRERNRRTWDGP
ncbi:MAG: DUF1194 domain-containing protein [Rhodobacteraceae bacterium]|nr:DUF1194 domain-containing protein [Paracoccaceae bacterium]